MLFVWVCCTSFLLVGICALKSKTLFANEPAYVVKVHDQTWANLPEHMQTKLTSEMYNPRPIVMTSGSNGRAFDCFLPETNETGRQKSSVPNQKQHKKQENVHQTLVSFGREAVRQLGSECLQWPHTTDHWIYEVCPSVTIRKILKEGAKLEKENDGEHEVVSLGEYNSWDGKEVPISFSLYHPSTYQQFVMDLKHPLYTQHYHHENEQSEGDVTASSTVQYVCASDNIEKPRIVGFLLEANGDQSSYKFLIASPVFCMKTEELPNEEDSHAIRSIINSIHDGESCILKNGGWWTYEFCFGQFVRQFHREQSGLIGSEFTLGKFDDEQNPITITKAEAIVYQFLEPTDEEMRPALVEYYNDGTLCDETGVGRTTKVLYFCGSGPNPTILSIKETQTCSYTLKVLTRAVCKHPQFAIAEKKKGENSYDVHCIPQTIKKKESSEAGQ